MKQTKHKTKKPSQKPDKKKLDKDCLDLWSDIAIARDHVCRNCGSDQYLSSHHVRVKSHKATRYDIENALTLCWRHCHYLQKVQPERFHDMVIDIIGQKEYDRLKAKSSIEVHYKIPDLLEIKEHLKNQLKRMV